MTTVTLASSFSFASAQDWDWVVSVANSSSMVITSGAYKQTFTGSFTYDENDIVYGTVTATSFYINNALIYSVSGMTANATQLQDYTASYGDTQDTYAYIFQANDNINGSSANDSLLGYTGNDVITGGAGNDFLDGGTGTDSAVFAGNYAAASIQYSAATARFTVITAAGGTDTLTGIETLVFADKSVTTASLMAPPDDYAATTLTTGRLTVGNSVTGRLETLSDNDWFAITLTAGQHYRFNLDGGTGEGLDDPYLKLYNASGTLLAQDDDSGTGLNALLTYSATQSGTYFLGASRGAASSDTGSYALSAATTVVVDTTAPTVSAFSPASGSGGVAISANIQLTFNEAIQRGTGSIVLKDAAGTVVESFAASSSNRLSITGSTLTIDPSVALANGVQYFISFAAGTLKDLAGNAYQGSTTYNFTTQAVNPATGSGLELVSASYTGAMDDAGTNTGSDSAPVISADGRFVVFNSWATNLIVPDAETNSIYADTYYKDLQSGQIEYAVTTAADLRPTRPTGTDQYGKYYYGENFSMSADGRYVAFETTANFLVDLTWLADPNSPTGGTLNATTVTSGDYNANKDIYVKNLATGAIKLVSATVEGLSPDTSGLSGSGSTLVSHSAALSADAQYVAFTSFATNLIAGDTNLRSDIFLKDIFSGAIERISTNATGVQSNGNSDHAVFSADGRYVFFESNASNLVSGDSNALWDIFRKDLHSGAIDRVSTATNGAQTLVNDWSFAASTHAAVSANGRYLVFESTAENLVGDDTNHQPDIFYKDLVTGTTQRVSVSATGAQITDTMSTSAPSISADGRYVVFNSNSAQLVAENALYDGGSDVFIKDMHTGAIKAVSAFPNDRFGAPDHSQSIDGSISADGNYIVLKSTLQVDDSTSPDWQVYRVNNPFFTLTGTALANALTGNLSSDTLDGLGAQDTLKGGKGDDIYIVDLTDANALQDIVTENANEGNDSLVLRGGNAAIAASSLALGANLDNLDASRTGGTLLTLTGNAQNNVLTGNAANNILNGGTGADTLIGGDGSDSYYVDNSGDLVRETNALAAGGTDTVYSYIGAYTLGANVENGRILASGAANLSGNGLNNLLYAGAGNDILNGATGLDTVSYLYATSAVTLSLAISTAQVTGGSGSDTLLNIEHLTGSKYHDKLTGNTAANTLNGGAGNDSLNGGTGADRMIGGDGSDTYYLDNAGDVVSETNALAAGGTDIVYSYLGAYTLGTYVENGRILASTAANLTGNGLSNLLYAGAGNNVLNGGAGLDTVSYAYAASAVTAALNSNAAQATAGSGNDTLLNFEHLTGSKYHDKLTGNALANTLTGGAGNDTLWGGLGNDLLIGGQGVDRLNGGGGADRFDFNALNEMGLGALRDVVGDFLASAGDKLDLSTLDANTATPTNDAFSFIGSAAFSAAGQLRFASGVLYGSTDADSSAEFEIQLLGVSTLNSSDLIV